MNILLGGGNVLIGLCRSKTEDDKNLKGVSLSVTGIDFGVGSVLKGRQVNPDLTILSKNKEGLMVLRNVIDLAIKEFDKIEVK